MNYWVRLFQVTYSELLEQTRNPQVGGDVYPENTSPNAGIIVGVYVELTKYDGLRVGAIIEFR